MIKIFKVSAPLDLVRGETVSPVQQKRIDSSTQTVLKLKEEGITDWIFGDLFLEDVRAYRENLYNPIQPNFWKAVWKPIL